ncbi:RidA family protein [Achromobacter sp.]|uniref:RidA family protein n=1 Tax=Achromobacter sp. TaxID=134375 RepID=UPI00289FE8DA|nr:RidA family protein [Achromobacter sp.]
MKRPSTVEARLTAAGWRLPDPPVPRGGYAPFHEMALPGATLVHVSGQASRLDGVPIVGVCRKGADLEPARQACAQAALSALAALRLACDGDLGRVRAVPQLRGYLRTDANFGEHSAVLDGASQVLQAAFAGMPRPARTAVGVSSLPGGCWAEVELSALVDKPA